MAGPCFRFWVANRQNETRELALRDDEGPVQDIGEGNYSPMMMLAIAMCAVVGCVFPLTHSAPNGASLLAEIVIPANTLDASGLTGEMGANNIPRNTLGGQGSAITWLGPKVGRGAEYLMLSDRGPGDGGVAYPCRWHRVRLNFGSSGAAGFEVLSTVMLTDESGRSLIGNSGAYSQVDPAANARYDPEGIAVGPDGTVYVSEEYGPSIDAFDAAGKRVRRFAIPDAFMIKTPDGVAENELPPANVSGRQANRGFEGLTMSPDGSKLFAILQSPLIQDGGLDRRNKRVGENIRILCITIASGATEQFVYPLESSSYGVSEILAISATELLVLERDGKGGVEAEAKFVAHINLSEASDVSSVLALPRSGLPNGVRAVDKKILLDVLAPAFVRRSSTLRQDQVPEKFEGLTFGPAVDGVPTLVMSVDNDFRPEQPSLIYVFTVPEITHR